MKTPLIYIGKKDYLYEYIKDILDKYINKKGYTFVELFSGSGAISFLSEFKKVILNDKNYYVYLLLDTFKKGIDIFKYLDNIEIDKKTYYDMRNKLNQLIKSNKIETNEGRALLYYINRIGFKGFIRTNKSNLINTPYGYRKKLIKYDVNKVKEIMREWKIFNLNYKDVPIKDNYIIYVDPPYYKTNGFYKNEFGDINATKDVINYVSTLNNPVIYSNHYNDEIKQYLINKGFEIKVIDKKYRFYNYQNKEILAFNKYLM